MAKKALPVQHDEGKPEIMPSESVLALGAGNPIIVPLRSAAALIAAIAALALLTPAASAAPHLSQIGSFTEPVYVTAPPADPHRVFVVEQGGTIMVVRDGQKLDTPFLDITTIVKAGGEQGLLSMAFAPDYATSGLFYVYYTAPFGSDPGNMITVDEFQRAPGNPDAAGSATRRNIFTVDHPTNTNHNGGQLQFGPDGLLYAGTGDGGSGNDPPNNAQTGTSRLGKMLRVDPLSAGAANPQIYASGLRNPFRFSFDRQTGDLIIGDVGQSQREEVDFTLAGTPAGINYGWRCWEGTIHTPGISPACDPPGHVPPVLEKNHETEGYRAIIGGYVVRDPGLPELNGRYVYGDNAAQPIQSVVLTQPGTSDADTGLTITHQTSFGEDSCGHVYAASGDGPVYRIDGDAFTPCPEPAPVKDTRAPAVSMNAQRVQRPLRVGGFRVAMSCDELCGATATGIARIAGSEPVYVLAPVTRQLAAGRRVKVKLRASARALRAFESAFRDHRRVRVTLTVTVRDAAGNAGSNERRVRAKR